MDGLLCLGRAHNEAKLKFVVAMITNPVNKILAISVHIQFIVRIDIPAERPQAIAICFASGRREIASATVIPTPPTSVAFLQAFSFSFYDSSLKFQGRSDRIDLSNLLEIGRAHV